MISPVLPTPNTWHQFFWGKKNHPKIFPQNFRNFDPFQDGTTVIAVHALKVATFKPKK